MYSSPLQTMLDGGRADEFSIKGRLNYWQERSQFEKILKKAEIGARARFENGEPRIRSSQAVR